MPAAGDVEYPLVAGDILYIDIFGDEDLTGEYEINSLGSITFPLIGVMPAAGRGVSDLQDEITTALSDGYLIDPKVSVEVKSLRPFYILGEVRAPGTYPIKPNMDVFKAIAAAGGLTPRAKKNSVIIYRGFGEARVAISADDATPIYPGDSIQVEERFF